MRTVRVAVCVAVPSQAECLYHRVCVMTPESWVMYRRTQCVCCNVCCSNIVIMTAHQDPESRIDEHSVLQRVAAPLSS